MSRQYRNTAQWLELIEAVERSGQTQIEFCAALKLNPKYFSKRRSELLNTHSDSAFVQVQAQSISTPAADSGASLALRFQQTELTLPLSVEHSKRNNTREPARSDKKKPQPKTVGVSLLVEPGGFEPPAITNRYNLFDTKLLKCC